MGNSLIEPSLFRYSNCTWTQTKDPQTLIQLHHRILGHVVSKKFVSIEEYEALKIRAKNNKFLVDILAVLSEEKLSKNDGNYKNAEYAFLPCSQIQNIQIVRERIIYRLSDIGPCSYEDGLYILGQVLRACQILFAKYAEFYVHEDMIGFNCEGKCKFWFNTNFDSFQKELSPLEDIINQQNPQQGVQIKNDGECSMVRRIFLIIEQRMQIMMTNDEKKQYFQAKQRIIPQKQPKFDEAIILIEQICQQLNLSQMEYRVQASVCNDFQKFTNYITNSFKSSNCLQTKKQGKLSLKKYSNMKNILKFQKTMFFSRNTSASSFNQINLLRKQQNSITNYGFYGKQMNLDQIQTKILSQKHGLKLNIGQNIKANQINQNGRKLSMRKCFKQLVKIDYDLMSSNSPTQHKHHPQYCFQMLGSGRQKRLQG